MSRLHRLRLVGLVAFLALLLGLAGAGAPVQAAPLTGGNTIYLIDGMETTFTFDPINRKDGQLVPEEVFHTLGFTIAEQGREVTLTRGELSAVLTLASTHARVAGEPLTLAPGPIGIDGRLFLPVTVLPEFGFEVISDSGFLQIRDLADDLPTVEPLTKAAWEAKKERQTIRGLVRSDDRSIYLNAEVTWLTPDLVASSHFQATYRQRVEYLHLLRTSSLTLVTVSNQTGRSGAISPVSLMLVDSQGTQYDVVQSLAHRGLISQKVAAGAAKSTVLVYPGVGPGTKTLSVFSATNDGTLGTLQLGN